MVLMQVEFRRQRVKSISKNYLFAHFLQSQIFIVTSKARAATIECRFLLSRFALGMETVVMEMV
jgi:hypothetical protein